MSIALNSVLLLILLIPGLLFTRFYYSEEFSKEYIKTSLFQTISMALFPALIIQTIGIILLKYCHQYDLIQYSIDLEVISYLIVESQTQLFKSLNSIHDNLSPIVRYHVFLWVTSIFLGWSIKFFVRILKLDRRFKIFRFQNSWHYIITGELLDFKKIKRRGKKNGKLKKRVNFIFIDAMVELTEKTMIYRGILEEYLLSSNGSLDLIYLKSAKKKYLGDSEFKSIAGGYLVLKYDQIKNLNITYYNKTTSNPNKWGIAEFIGMFIGISFVTLPVGLMIYWLILAKYVAFLITLICYLAFLTLIYYLPDPKE